VFPVGGVAVMLLGVVLAGAASALVALALRGRTGRGWAWSVGLLLWSLACLAVITLIPADGAPGIVYADEQYYQGCSFDYGGPSPDGFWIFSGGQRLLNAVVFVPSGVLWVLVAGRWPRALTWSVPLGLVLLAAYSAGIEATQLVLARLDRACDVTDVVDNVAGAAIGLGAGLLLLPLVRPWRR